MNFKVTLAYWFHYLFFTILILIVPIIYFYFLINLNPLALIYLLWYIYDFNCCDRGARINHWLRNISFWPNLAKSFPFKLIRTEELSPNRNYLFACHPHGLFSVAPLQLFTTNSGDFSKQFPQLTSYMVTLKIQFLIPFYRELLLALGYCSSSAKSIEYLLCKSENKATGNVVALMIGGTEEMLLAKPDTMALIIHKRRGFIRLALKNGASIVPVISFGENNLYRIIDSNNAVLNFFQKITKKILGVPLVLFMGNLIMFPRRKPVWTVVGSPIHIDEPIQEPTDNDIDKVQEQYINKLKQLYEEHKNQYNHSKIELLIH